MNTPLPVSFRLIANDSTGNINLLCITLVISIIITIAILILILVYANIRNWLFLRKFKPYLKKQGYEYLGQDIEEESKELRKIFMKGAGSKGVRINYHGLELTGLCWTSTEADSVVVFFVLMTPIFIREEGHLILREKMNWDNRPGVFIKKKKMVEFESEEFNNRINVEGEPKKFVYDVMTPRMCQIFLKKTNISMKIKGKRIILFRQWIEREGIIKLLKPEYKPLNIRWLEESMECMSEILNLVPRYMMDPIPEFRSKKRHSKIRNEEDLILKCPECEHTFKKQDKGTCIKCPKCGTEGEV